MCFYHDGYAEFSDLTYPKLRKAQTCGECFRTIPAGEVTMHVAMKFDGEFYSDYYCGECSATRFRVHLHELAEGCRGAETWCPHGDLKSYCDDAGFRRSTHFVGQLYLAAKRNRESKLRAQRKLDKVS